jgi:hypothetical protein
MAAKLLKPFRFGKGVLAFVTTRKAGNLSLYIGDSAKKVIAAAHAGWRGTALRIAEKTVNVMRKLGSRPKDMIVGIGPSIGPCCYEVGPKVSRKFGKSGCVHINLRRENRDQLIKLGIISKNIYICKTCTMCNSDRFFSARASKGQTGGFGAGIMLA